MYSLHHSVALCLSFARLLLVTLIAVKCFAFDPNLKYFYTFMCVCANELCTYWECLVKLSVMLSISIQMSNRLIFLFVVDNIVYAVNMVDIVEVAFVDCKHIFFFARSMEMIKQFLFTMIFDFQGKCHCVMQFSLFPCDKAIYRFTNSESLFIQMKYGAHI